MHSVFIVTGVPGLGDCKVMVWSRPKATTYAFLGHVGRQALGRRTLCWAPPVSVEMMLSSLKPHQT